MIRDPQGSIMPRVPMTQATLDLIASYLVQREPSQSPSLRPPPSDPGPTATQAGVTGVLYARSCSPCHGVRGAGDGYNASFLPVRPTAHSDATYMSRRSDDALFDAIYAGGYIMNRSNRMPSFGHTLAREQIWSLVRYLRTLCQCEGPAWSRDNNK
jgi:mono/diheme cytochrome c family protein